MVLESFHAQEAKGGPDAANKEKDQEPFGPPYIFQDASEHPKRKHIKENMSQRTVHEQVRDQLIRLEQGRLPVVEGEQIFQGIPENGAADILGQEHQHINDKQVLNDGRQYPE